MAKDPKFQEKQYLLPRTNLQRAMDEAKAKRKAFTPKKKKK